MIDVVAAVIKKNMLSENAVKEEIIRFKKAVKKTEESFKKIVNDSNKTNTATDELFIKNKLRNDLGQFVFQKTKRRPMILPVVIEV